MQSSRPKDEHALQAGSATNFRNLYGFSWVVAVAAFFLLLAGSMVTSTDSGDAIPTWPAPAVMPMEGGVFFELGHRYVAAFVGLLAIGLWLAVEFRRQALPGSVLKSARAAAGLVVVLAILGGVRVLVGNKLGDQHVAITVIGIGHGLLGQTFFCLTAATVYLLRRAREGSFVLSGDPVLDRRCFRWTRMVILVLYLQLILGGLVRFTRPGPVDGLVLLHVVGAVMVIYAVVELPGRVPGGLVALRRASFCALVLLAVQFVLGIFTYFVLRRGSSAPAEWTGETLLPSFHFGVGALLLMTAILMHLALRGKDPVEVPVA